MKTYQTVSGHVIEYTPTPDVAKYLAKVIAMAGLASEAELTAAIYSPDNPVMDAKTMPGRGMVTPAVLADPVYHVMADILARKSMDVRGVKPAEVAKHFTKTVAEAAEELGISRNAVYKAAESGRLAAWMVNGQQMIDPRSIASYDLKPRGPMPAVERERPSTDPLEICEGRDGPLALQVVKATNGEFELAPPGLPGAKVGTVPKWRRVGVFTSSGEGKPRFFVLEPSDKSNEVKLGRLYVRGKFGIVEKFNSPRRAREAFESFVAA